MSSKKKTAIQRAVNWAKLCPEILLRIASFCNPKSLLTACRVCRKWNRVAKSSAAWRDQWDLFFGGQQRPSIHYRGISMYNHFRDEYIQMQEYIHRNENASRTLEMFVWALEQRHCRLTANLAMSNPSFVSTDRLLINNYTALCAVAYNPHLVNLFLELGARTHLSNSVKCRGRNVMHQACSEACLDTMILLHSKYGVKLDGMCKGYSLLYRASQLGFTDIVAYLIANGVDVNERSPVIPAHPSPPLYIACQNGHFSIAAMLLNAGALVDYSFRGFTPLYVAARNGHLQVLQLLIERGADLERCEGDTSTPLYVASQNGRAKCVDALLKAGANIETTFERKTPVYIAAANGNYKCLDLLIAAGADLNVAVETTGRTPLHAAVANYHYQSVSQLCKSGRVNLDAVDRCGRTSLAYALEHKLSSIETLLASSGASYPSGYHHKKRKK